MQELKDQTSIKIDIKAYLFEQLLKNPEYFFVNQALKEARVMASKKGDIKNALNNKDSIIDGYLKNQMHWKYGPNKKISLTFEPNEFNILRSLVVALNKKVSSNEWLQNWETDNKFLTTCSAQIKDYLLARPQIDRRSGNYFYSKSYKGWYLVEANTNLYRLQNVKAVEAKPKRIVSRQSDRVKNLLSKTTTIWYNTK